MSNKFVRGITGIEDINDQGLETNDINDLLSTKDGKVYVRTTKGYVEITNSDDSEIISIKEEVKQVNQSLSLLENRIDVLENK